MRTRTFLVAGAAILVASCAEMPKMQPTTTEGCSGTCDVDVNVLGCVIQPIEPLHVKPGTHVVKWSLRQGALNRYRFAPNGIEFASSSAPFDQPQHPGPQVFTWRDTNPGDPVYHLEKHWKYTITVLDGGVPCPDPLDPYVINDP